jgi:flagellar protein FlaG
MDINGVANHAIVSFPQRMPAGPAPDRQADRQTDPETAQAVRAREAAASLPGIRTQESQPVSPIDDPSTRAQGGAEALQTAVEKIQEFIRKAASDIEFSIDEDSGRTVVKVVDRETEEVIRQIPSQEMLDLAQALDKLQGLLIKQKA